VSQTATDVKVAGMSDPRKMPPVVTFGEAFNVLAQLGFTISFGGPAGQIARSYTELVRSGAAGSANSVCTLNFCMCCPAPRRSSSPPYIGWLMHRTWGGIVAGALFVLPVALFDFVIALSLGLPLAFGEVPVVRAPSSASRRSRRSSCMRRTASARISGITMV
jgi:chromate transporter